MQVVVGADGAAARWELVAGLGLPAGAAFAIEEAFARVAHPSGGAVDAVVVVVRDHGDLQHVARHVRGGPRSWVPVVVVAPTPGLARAARVAGAAWSLVADGPADTAEVRSALVEVTAPAVVVDLASMRETA